MAGVMMSLKLKLNQQRRSNANYINPAIPCAMSASRGHFRVNKLLHLFVEYILQIQMRLLSIGLPDLRTTAFPDGLIST